MPCFTRLCCMGSFMTSIAATCNSDCLCSYISPERALLQIKQTLIGSGLFSDTVPCHIASGLGAGFFAVCVGSPVDVVKSRMMGMSRTLHSMWSVQSRQHVLIMTAYSLHFAFRPSEHTLHVYKYHIRFPAHDEVRAGQFFSLQSSLSWASL